MSTETNKAVLMKMFNAVEKELAYNRFDVLDDVCAPDMVTHDPSFSGTVHGLDAFKQLWGVFGTAFPGHRVSVEAMIAEGDYVAVLHTHYAKHTGPFMGIPPTGREFAEPGCELYRLQNGRIVEFWRFDADAILLRTLGLVPA